MRKMKYVILLMVVLFASVTSCNLFKSPDTGDGDIAWTKLEAVFKDTGGTEIPHLVIGAVHAETGKVYSSVTGTDGKVTLKVPQGQSYILSVIAKEGRSYGSAVVETAGARKPRGAAPASMGLKSPDSAAPLDMGDILLPADPKTEPLVVSVPAGSVDSAYAAAVDGNGVPVGIANYGRPGSGSSSLPLGHYTGDPDLDGLPNIIDSDDDGDGILDDWDKDSDGDGSEDSAEGFYEEDAVEFRVGYLLDIRGGEGIYSYFGSEDDKTEGLVRDMRADLWLQINDSDRIDAVTSVALYADSSPSYATELTAAEFDTADNVQDFVDGSSYNPGTGNYNTDWSYLVNDDDVPYQLSVSDTDTDTDRLVCRVGLKLPEGSTDLYAVGDVFTVEVRYAAGSGFDTEYYSEMINYVYENVTRFEAFSLQNSGDTPGTGDFINVWYGVAGTYPGDADDPIELTYETTDQNIWFKIIPPQDDEEDYITTGGFRYEIFDNDYVGSRLIEGWQEDTEGHYRYDSDLDDEEKNLTADPQYFMVPIPVEYILDSDQNEDEEIDIEYFMNINEDSYIKNRLRFSIAPSS